MLPRPRPCRFPLLRLLALAWLACGVLAEPLASALGELHTYGHAQADVHLHVDHVGQEHDDESALLHALMHGGHCHGHCAAILPQLPLAALALGDMLMPLAVLQQQHEHRLSTCWRPPIQV